MWRGTVQKFSSGGSGFDPSFSKAEKVRIVGVDQIRQCLFSSFSNLYYLNLFRQLERRGNEVVYIIRSKAYNVWKLQYLVSVTLPVIRISKS